MTEPDPVRALGALVLWEELPLQAAGTFQDQIDVVAANVDIAAFIVWSKIGTPVIVAGKRYQSGTEREFDLMLRTLEDTQGDRPDILFYFWRAYHSFQRPRRFRGPPQGPPPRPHRPTARPRRRQPPHRLERRPVPRPAGISRTASACSGKRQVATTAAYISTLLIWRVSMG